MLTLKGAWTNEASGGSGFAIWFAAVFGYGEQRDDETGLVNLRARYYDPSIGRFLSRDTLPGAVGVPQSWNRYAYVGNDPVNAQDPSGHKKRSKIVSARLRMIGGVVSGRGFR